MATGGGSKEKKQRRGRDRQRTVGVHGEQGGVVHHVAIHPIPLERRAGERVAPDGAKVPVFRVRRAEAVARVSAAARRLAAEWSDAAVLLRSLAGSLAEGRRRGGRREAIAAAIARCLDEASLEAPGAGRFALDEGATWALAWLARGGEPEGRDRALLDRLLDEARSAGAALADGDTRAAPFVLTAAGLFSDPSLRGAEASAAAVLSADVVRWTSAEGAPAAGGSAVFVPRVAGWTRARDAAVATRRGIPWDDLTEKRWRNAAVAALRLVGGGGRLPAGGGTTGFDAHEVLETLRRAAGSSENGPQAGRLRRTIAVVAGELRGEPRRGLSRDAVDGSVAILRSGWSARSLRILLDFGGAVHRLEVASGRTLVMEGEWPWWAEADGTALEPTSGWSTSCFESDDDATFLEIVAALPHGLQAERQIILLPRDRIVILADAITDAGALLAPESRPTRLSYRTRLPLSGVGIVPEEETREVLLGAGGRQWRLLPLALPEWRAAPSSGALEVAGSGLELRQEALGGRLAAPVWIDADPGRSRRPVTWRQLTVADQRRNLRRHEAVGFRVQAGHDQWLLYRALDTPRNRTVLGCNVASELLLGRVRRSGEIARTLEIE